MTAADHTFTATFTADDANDAAAQALARCQAYYGVTPFLHRISTERVESMRGDLLHYKVTVDAIEDTRPEWERRR